MTYDYIIIGAGLGGLCAGAKLAKEGKHILVLEQHDRPGGCATTFKRRDFTMEVGLHEMDGLHPRDKKNKLFDDLGISERVEFLPVPEFYRFVNEWYDLVIPHDPEEAKALLKKAFPDEEEGIDAYFFHVLNARRVLVQHRNQPEKSVGQFLDEIISNEDLKLVLLGNLGYFHDDPYSLSWLYYLNAQGSYYGGRANFIKGGSQQLSNALADIITAHGGEVKLNMLATSIDYEGSTPVGVSYKSIRGKDKGSYSDRASDIIVNASIPQLADTLLSKADGKKLITASASNNIGASLLTVYYGFSKPLKELGNKHYSMFIYDPSVRNQKDIFSNNHSDFSTRSFTFVDYSQIDSGLAPDGKSVGAVCCIDYPADWENLSREEYNRMKSDVIDTFNERLEKLIPGFMEHIEYAEAGTSLTIKRFTMNPEGAVYGFAQNPDKATTYLDALPENVHLASAWGKFGGGFSGAIFSGYMCATDLLRKT
jgi:phytoene dehydrogenase-like protein